jgi:hypothetical protein
MCTMRLRNNFHLVAKGWVCGSNYLLSKALEFVIRVEQSHKDRPLVRDEPNIQSVLWTVRVSIMTRRRKPTTAHNEQ